MSTLRAVEKARLEDLLDMSGGYVLDFTDSSFAAFFRDAGNISIGSPKYSVGGTSKAKRLRAFWELEPDVVVGRVLLELLEYWNYKHKQPTAEEMKLAAECRRVIDRLLGKEQAKEDTEQQFLGKDYGQISFRNIDVDSSVIPILEARYKEAVKCLKNGAPLAAIFLCGSILEGSLLGLASAKPQEFNQAHSSPKDPKGKARHFHEWTLSQFIDVAYELGYLKLDVKKFGHELRDFRNYIHPYEQMASRFSPDKHTAEICMQVLKAAIASLSGERS